MLTIPQIAILGDQSSGKSSVLAAIIKLSFPRNVETCTHFATQVNIRQSERAEMSAHIDDEPEFNERNASQDKAWNIHTTINEANGILYSNVEVSEIVLKIIISGPTSSLLTIIDLPGHINTTTSTQDKGNSFDHTSNQRAVQARHLRVGSASKFGRHTSQQTQAYEARLPRIEELGLQGH
ncbi:P-loop containing nucleoside triphosphate hydrolase protein [Gamsiella multidivaricata]|uniref:P-loop containing nucleoside triphosphate hydrolase protein n=1 Tax=Gamsiella multidivaricata TaxID=101098 RepID=UPI00221EADA3|nr:P-loop containing nucleoside triphosphate hydrolase protein [Gamsiella multidivaricata]KAI7827446.1 P-loop containing nucleoside triphosphate hydrolase protein [Gamsiella multidivaricata]